MAKDKSSKQAKQAQPEQPYSSMGARKVVLYIGFVLSLVGFIAVLVGALFLFLPKLNFLNDIQPAKLLTVIFAVGVGVCVVSVIFAVAGANTSKIIARFSFLFDILAFIVGAAMLLVVLVLRVIIPIPALEALTACFLI